MEHVLSAGIERLHGWALGLPWVVERPGIPDAPAVRLFAVDCEPLGRRRAWMATGPLVGSADQLDVRVVLPLESARRVAGRGHGDLAAHIGNGRGLVCLRLEPDDELLLHEVLLVAYEASFAA
jgi:hypothetical protein